ncbi:hypothetical protein FHE25_04705 [Salmonella enterica]|uniref:Type 1 fimbrial protein n=3 Tax=Salmonella enterica TaxID=28901 RepID=A0A7Z1T0J9_SALET|nr:hypothetical protein [Salmonella enterica]EEJ6653244.1 hypothetical protein [Salmonella enterica subsp. enterica serovar Redlands]EAM2984763.1 hypothetical protein [Salmonella enterica]EAO9251614.1 hypothetical protein [Salmonella enterica]EAQ9982985.1 hypothetical protein [Salmonella enterica]EAV1934037.1 hypothetical protein [Salmonella enterica]
MLNIFKTSGATVLFMSMMFNLAIASPEISSGSIKITGRITVPTCLTTLSNDDVRQSCIDREKVYTRWMPLKDIKADNTFESIRSINIHYLNESHKMGILSVTYK